MWAREWTRTFGVEKKKKGKKGQILKIDLSMCGMCVRVSYICVGIPNLERRHTPTAMHVDTKCSVFEGGPQ